MVDRGRQYACTVIEVHELYPKFAFVRGRVQHPEMELKEVIAFLTQMFNKREVEYKAGYALVELGVRVNLFMNLPPAERIQRPREKPILIACNL